MSELVKEGDILVGGAKLDIDRASIKPELGSKSRKGKGATGHYVTESKAGKVKFKLAVTPTLDLEAVESWVDKTVQIIWDNKRTEQSQSMYTAELGEPDDEGYVEVTMAGTPFKTI